MITPDRVRELLFAAWGRQSCQVHPSDWPEVLHELLKDSNPGPGRLKRASLKPLVDGAIEHLVAAFGGGAPLDPINVVYLAFPRLDLQHRTELAKALATEAPSRAEAAE
jgi:hypothetical protein